MRAWRVIRGSEADRRWGPPELLVSSLALALLVYVLVQRSGFAELSGVPRLALQGEEPWLLPATLLSTSLIALLPGALAALVLLRLAGQRASRAVFVLCSSLALFVLTLDLDLMCSIGRHLAEVVRVALQPEGHVAGGSPWQWLRTLLGWALLAGSSSWTIAQLASRGVRPLALRLTPLVRHALGAAITVLAVALVLVPHCLYQAWVTPGLYERVYAALLFDPRIGSAAAEDDERVDPALGELSTRLGRAYRVAFPALGAGERGSAEPVALPQQRPPNVILIVTESLRHDVFGEELMPRLTHWAQAGLTASQHDSGTNYSQSALFALLYGRSPALYHQTLNAKVPPQLCVTLRASGYECAYFSGHPKVWLRREEFVNAQTMDHFVHDDTGTWPDWDRHALDGMVKLASESKKPIFAIVLLMSSHFEYRYPPEYEHDLPVASSAWNVTSVRALGAADREPHRNRYRNCMRFIDDIVSDAIGRLDPQRNLVLFTGDHGESIFDDGRYTHGYSFAEIETRTPLAIVGPGVAPGTLERPTYHVDVLPSVLHLLSGAHVAIPHIQGSDWFADEPPSSVLVAHSTPDGRVIQTQLRTDGLRLRLDLDMRAPRVRLLGFEDSLGHLIVQPALGSEAENELVGALEAQLLALRR